MIAGSGFALGLGAHRAHRRESATLLCVLRRFLAISSLSVQSPQATIPAAQNFAVSPLEPHRGKRRSRNDADRLATQSETVKTS